MQVWPGEAYPLGATYDGAGTNFAVFSEAADRIELCLLQDDGSETAVELRESDAFVRHAYLPGIMPGQRYGFRLMHGTRPNADSASTPPAAAGSVRACDQWLDQMGEEVYSYPFGVPTSATTWNSAPHTMTSVVVNPYFDWGDDRRPRTEYHHTVIYEAHVKGLTMQHPALPEELRGTYAALAHPAIIEHLTELGVTALEPTPVHQFVNDHRLVEMGLNNYWGYNTIGFFAPHNTYASWATAASRSWSSSPRSGRCTRPGSRSSWTWSTTTPPRATIWARPCPSGASTTPRTTASRTIPATTWTPRGPARLMRSPHVLQLIMDSWRYWVTEMHVDGFRFDLAATLARQFHEVDRLSSFFDLVQQDPVVSQAEADRRALGRRRGRLPGGHSPLWTEWNGKYRDTVRDLVRRAAHAGGVRLAADRLLRPLSGRRPPSPRLHQLRHLPRRVHAQRPRLLQQQAQRGQRRGQPRRREPQPVLELRRRGRHRRRGRTRAACQKRNFIATLMLSQGVPMLSHGDEFARTQNGNNNADRQDSELAWVPWPDNDGELLDFTRAMVWLRRDHPVFRARGLPRPPRPGHPRRAVRHRVVHPGGHRDHPARLGSRRRRRRCRSSSTATRSPSRARAVSTSPTTPSC